MSDKILWKRIQNDDHQALKEIFDSYYQVLCSYILQFTHNIDESEDIVQATFIKLWSKRQQIHISISIKSYLFRSAYHLFVDEYKKQKRDSSVLEEIKYKVLISSIEEDIEVKLQRTKKIKELVNGLPQKCKEILLLSKETGLKNKEIAAKLDISIKTVESQIRIAFQKIRDNF